MVHDTEILGVGVSSRCFECKNSKLQIMTQRKESQDQVEIGKISKIDSAKMYLLTKPGALDRIIKISIRMYILLISY